MMHYIVYIFIMIMTCLLTDLQSLKLNYGVNWPPLYPLKSRQVSATYGSMWKASGRDLTAGVRSP